ncbi:MAG TPA: Spy/CpxP family protein refolding chaperone [Terriglobales bacterium]|jgi:protein CpxP|nr:Spy/CpxP family protein refolding chaperone [Terriglobales bacterium]
MTARRLKITLAVVAILVTGIAVAVAQGPMYHVGFGGPEHHMWGFLTKQLDLTEAQHTQVKDIFAKEKSSIGPLMMQKEQLHQQLMQEAISGTFNPTKVQALAAQQGQLEAALAVEHAKIASQIYNVLTADQKTKAQQVLQQHQQRMEEHMKRMQQGEQGPLPPEE